MSWIRILHQSKALPLCVVRVVFYFLTLKTVFVIFIERNLHYVMFATNFRVSILINKCIASLTLAETYHIQTICPVQC